MGTRADFYIKRGNEMEWLGSISWDGYDIGEIIEEDATKTARNKSCWDVKQAKTEEQFRDALDTYYSFRDDVRLPTQGWPWPWEDSNLTDRAYVFEEEKVRMFQFGKEIRSQFGEEIAPHYPVDSGDDRTMPANFKWPNMEDIQNVTDGGFIVLVPK